MYYEIAIAIFGSIYLSIGTLLVWRRNNPNISKRSPWLVNISHWSNFFELALIIPTASIIVVEDNYSDTWWQARDAGILICHFLIFLTYILRGYRLHTVFKISYINDFSRHIYKTPQKYLIRLLLVLMTPVFLLAIVIFFVKDVAVYFPVSEANTSSEMMMASSCVYITVCFIEQLVLFYLVYYLRFIDDKYTMNNELIWIAGFWCISPAFSVFVNSSRRVWLGSIIARNLLLLVRSSLVPVISSFIKGEFEEPLTLDMLNSLEIILINQRSLRYFERFLKSNECGMYILEFYQKCEVKCNEGSQIGYDSINDYINSAVLPRDMKIENIDSIGKLAKAKNAAIKYLNEEFYYKFLTSPECEELRGEINKEEIITNRIRKTSLFRKNHIASKKPTTQEARRTSRTIGILLK